jgi:hypothetical protein
MNPSIQSEASIPSIQPEMNSSPTRGNPNKAQRNFCLATERCSRPNQRCRLFWRNVVAHQPKTPW